MARHQKDYFDHGGFYHIYNKTVTGRKLFETDSDYHDFWERYTKYFLPYFDTYAYCLVPNHYHFLVKVKDIEEIDVSLEKTNAAKKYSNGEESINFFLENQLSRMLSGIAIKYNNRSGKVGALFKEGTKRVELKTESRVIYQLCYIHHNVIHHHLGKNYGDWKYSSYIAYLSDKDSQLDRSFVIELMGGIDVFHDLHRDFKLDQKEGLFDEFEGQDH